MLTDAALRNIRPKSKSYKMTDRDGLYLPSSTTPASTGGEGLVFKGGASLSKAYDVIQRFSEDVDLTYDFRRLLPDLAGAAEDPVPETRAEERRWSREVQPQLPLWVEGEVGPMIEARLDPGGWGLAGNGI